MAERRSARRDRHLFHRPRRQRAGAGLASGSTGVWTPRSASTRLTLSDGAGEDLDESTAKRDVKVECANETTI